MADPVMFASNSDDLEKPSPSLFKVCFSILNSVTHLCLGATACSAYAVALIRKPIVSASYSNHILLCTTGYIILMSLAVLTLSPHTGWSSLLKHKEKKNIHWVMQILGSVLAITGSAIRIMGINNHLETTHGILGVVALVFLFVTLIGGVINLFSANLSSRKFFRFCHSCFGSVTLIIAFITLIYGFVKLYETELDGMATYASVIATLAVAGTILSAVVNSFKRLC